MSHYLFPNLDSKLGLYQCFIDIDYIYLQVQNKTTLLVLVIN